MNNTADRPPPVRHHHIRTWGEDRGYLMDQCSLARHPTGHPLLLTNRRGHGLSVGLDPRTRDTECSPAGGSDPRILLQYRPDARPLGISAGISAADAPS